MAEFNIIDRIKKKVENWLPKAAETDKGENWWYWVYLNEACKSFYASEDAERFCNEQGFYLAGRISEIFFPIDAIADRVASLPFDVVNQNGELADIPKNIQRLIDKPNAFTTFSDMMYNSVFNELSDGNNYIYTKTPRSFNGLSPDTISSIWLLEPDRVSIKIKSRRPKFFDITQISDVVEYYQYNKYDTENIDPRYIIHERSLQPGDYSEGLKSQSPLNACYKNIDNLLAVYSSRHNVYVKNGNAGILTRDGAANNNNLEQAVNPADRDQIVTDILNRNGLVGDKKLWTVSAIPLKFIKTIASIQELQPFEETIADAEQIAGVYGVDKDLLPHKESKYDNKENSEKNLITNIVMGVAHNKADTFTKAFALDKIGLKFQPNFKNIAVLKEDREKSLTGDSILINNIDKMKNAGLIEDIEAREILNKIIENYKNGN